MRLEIETLLKRYNNEEDGILIKIDIDEYLEKLFSFAKIISVISKGNLAGFIAYYQNDPQKIAAYLSMILVEKNTQSKGIGKQLINCAISDVIAHGFSYFRLEVLKNNAKAIAFYEKFGFKTIEDRDKLCLMELKLK
jgi:ribosomal protein S18 acetylase RimI-like enzyme